MSESKPRSNTMKSRLKRAPGQKEQRQGVEKPTAENGSHRKVKFQLAAAKGSRVFLAGSFNSWNPDAIELKPNGNGLYSTTIRLVPGRHEYKFLVDGIWQVDDRCTEWATNPLGSLNSVVEVT
ncbi:MAG: hypothetical protein C0404_00580 [Verrucomicrobia bacterium]|nr:hypothetical protein [Verrucomicrobiota bacterium]